MYIVEQLTNEHQLVHVTAMENNDFKKVTAKRYSFNWKKLKKECAVYKLTLIDSDDILGLIALVDHPAEERIEIELLALSAENIGKEKHYDRIAGCLIAFAANDARQKFKNYPAVSLVPKTEIRQHYIMKYKMIDAGWQLYLEDTSLLYVIKEYLS